MTLIYRKLVLLTLGALGSKLSINIVIEEKGKKELPCMNRDAGSAATAAREKKKSDARDVYIWIGPSGEANARSSSAAKRSA